MSTREATSRTAPTRAAGTASGQAGPLAEGSALTDPSSSAAQLREAFKRAMVAIRRLKGRESQRAGQLSFAQYGLLHGLSGRSECSARELAEHSDLSPATVAQMLEHLEAGGLVTRARSARDRRVVLSELTERGAAVLAQRQQHVEGRWKAAMEEFSEDELTAAARVLNRVADVFESLAEEPPAADAPAD